MLKKVIVASALLLLTAWIVVVFVTPWPSVLVIRSVFDMGAEEASAALAPKVPGDVQVQEGLSYDSADPDALLDIYRGAGSSKNGPTIVWFHGGGFVSGRRQDVSNYLKILAGNGFTVVNVDYTVAPEAAYPGPIRQANKALAYLTANSVPLRLDTDKLVLAGDSAGSQIAAQTAAMLTNSEYARLLGITPGTSADQIAGALLYCGVYDVTQMGDGGGILGWFVKSTTWAYSGKRNWRDVPGFKSMVIAPYVTSAFPKTFISAGNADPLGLQSVALSGELAKHGVEVSELFFPAGHQPPLGHEYQFDLELEAGQIALKRSVDWLRTL
ncbi:alpha/beta hydrolase [Pseudoxanthomonas sp. PXM02]|jgi:acetyl esterase|uniref:alpha/beta hydrolase n=1 Tax=Pseudoxanthomonas sp. PXM02 TaxID=2769294 RepID=UPI00177F4E9C|nr:alpha/beta hydrolase [Pseudoxanthomonas sp. PXM02]MBD9481290.1 alpha/beta hydrolase [Pseudoxanthomonas sp. PXM02]